MTPVLKSFLMIAIAAAGSSAAAAQDRAAPLPPRTVPASPFAELSAIDDGDLRKIAGREDVNQLSYANQVAGVSSNSVGNNSNTGDARISDNAFQNMSGLSILNINTGNNVAINAAMNVNISITPGQ